MRSIVGCLVKLFEETKIKFKDLNNWEESVIDYISGMMDEYAIAKYKEFFGENSLNTLYLR